MANERVTTIRLPIALADALELVARAESKPVAVVIREAIAAYITKRRADPEFQRRLHERIDADRKILERLSDGDGNGRSGQ